MPTDKDAKAPKNDASKEEPTIRKPAKKLIITDANEAVVQTEPVSKPAAKKISVIAHEEDVQTPDAQVGDTPAVTDTNELSSIAQAIESTAAATTTDKAELQPDDDQPEASQNETDVAAQTMTVGDAIDAAQGSTEDTQNTATPTETKSEQANLDVDQTIGEAQDQTATQDATYETTEPAQESTPDTPETAKKNDDFSDVKITNAIDEIVAAESDELLERQDAERIAEEVPQQKKQSKIKTLFKNWWVNPATKWGTIVGLLLVIALITVLPVSRYTLLNAAGVRVTTSMTVISNDNRQPLKNAQVEIDGQAQITNDEGSVQFTKLKLGKHTVVISKRGYAKVEQTKTLGWGSNPLGDVILSATGNKFAFVVKDKLSGKGLASAEAVSGDYNATADNEGKILLSVDQNGDGDVTVVLKAPDYRDETVIIKPTDTAEKTVELVASKKHVFISKRSGKYDVYKIDADGKNESVLLAATGSEREDMSVLTHPTQQYVAVVSTREGKRNKDGYVLSGLYIVNVLTGESQKIAQSERIQLIDWTGDRLVYIGIVDGASAANPARSKLYSFELGQPGAKELASANYFNDAVVFKGAVYYAPSSYAVPVANVKFYKTNPDGSGSSTLFDKEVWSVMRNDYDTLYLSVQQDWYELKQNGTATKLSGAPTSLRSRVYRESPDKKKALWIDVRDGKGVLLAYNTESKSDEILETRAGLTQPAVWLNNTTYIFRVSDGREVADYVKSTLGGDAKKLRDVTNTDMSYYYN